MSIPYTVENSSSGMEIITLTAWGESSGYEAVHVAWGDTIGAIILEPESRTWKDWCENFDEDNFRNDVLALVQSFEEIPDELIFDPANDSQTSIEL